MSVNENIVAEEQYVENAAVSDYGRQGKLPWGFWVLVAGCVWALVELVLSILYFFG